MLSEGLGHRWSPQNNCDRGEGEEEKDIIIKLFRNIIKLK